jgi:hypothetical protein
MWSAAVFIVLAVWRLGLLVQEPDGWIGLWHAAVATAFVAFALGFLRDAFHD